MFSFEREEWAIVPGRKREFSDQDKAELLHRLAAWRRDCSAISAKAPINEPIYIAVDKLRAAIDDVAETVTGNREHFWTKQAGIGKAG